MKILGIGVDITKNKRIKTSIKNKNFIKRIFSIKEIQTAKNKNEKAGYFAKRFAAKEAFVKALGTGFRENLNFKDIEILNDKLGKPYYLKSQIISRIIMKRFNIKRYNLFLSITDEKDYSVAFTIIQTQS
jgi:holo-[acyl-carrier protein] synthase